jgi:hypothetical protein
MAVPVNARRSRDSCNASKKVRSGSDVSVGFRIHDNDPSSNNPSPAPKYPPLASQVVPVGIYHHIKDDPDDDAVLACALATHADLIVSGDAHLLNLKHFHRIQIITPAESVSLITK